MTDTDKARIAAAVAQILSDAGIPTTVINDQFVIQQSVNTLETVDAEPIITALAALFSPSDGGDDDQGACLSAPGSTRSAPEAAAHLRPSGNDLSRDDYSTLDMADLHYAACTMEELASAVASDGAGRRIADRVDLGAQAVRLAIEILNDLYASVRRRDSDEHRNGQDPKGLGPEGMPARAAESGIAQDEAAIRADERERCARVAYRICAETRHVTLGDKTASAIRALPQLGEGERG